MGMTKNNAQLRLTRIGKENWPRLEPQILLEDGERLCHEVHRDHLCTPGMSGPSRRGGESL